MGRFKCLIYLIPGFFIKLHSRYLFSSHSLNRHNRCVLTILGVFSLICKLGFDGSWRVHYFQINEIVILSVFFVFREFHLSILETWKCWKTWNCFLNFALCILVWYQSWLGEITDYTQCGTDTGSHNAPERNALSQKMNCVYYYYWI